MAKATMYYKEEAKVVITEVPDTVTLELTIYEASVLYDLVGKYVTGVGKARDNGTSNIFFALRDAGVEDVNISYFKGSGVYVAQ